MRDITIDKIAQAISARIIKNSASDAEPQRRYDCLLTDSRSVFNPAKTIFAALRTDVNDGHKYIPALAAKGVDAFIVEEVPLEVQDSHLTFLQVDSVKDALVSLAKSRLEGVKNGVIISGSYGKTKVKELLYEALLPFAPVCRSPRSWNSAIGVPLSIIDLEASVTDKSIVLTEIGIDAPGQASNYDWLAPSHQLGILTPVNTEHDEAFPSHSDKVAEKIALVRHCSTIIYDGSDLDLSAAMDALVEECPDKKLIKVSVGSHPTIFHALVAEALGVLGYGEAAHGLDSLHLVESRRNIRTVSYGNTLVCDNFTADIRSLRDSLDFFRRNTTPLRRRVLILGNLSHAILSGENIHSLYAEAFSLAKAFGVDRIITFADEIKGQNFETDNLMLADINREFLAKCQNGEAFRDCQILLFGDCDSRMDDIEAALERADHDTTLEIDLDALVHNYNYYRSLLPAGTGIVGMVKASAYGTGAVEVGKTLQSVGAAYLAVAVVDEGVELREGGINMNIMVLNPVTNRYPALFGHHLEPAVFSLDELDRLIAEAESAGIKSYPVHIKLDTGMHRVGFLSGQIDAIVGRLATTDAVYVASAFSHLATADCLDKDVYTNKQIADFHAMTDKLRRGLGYDFKKHILNTAGMMRFADCGGYEMARLGIGLYGISPYDTPERSHLHPVASLVTRIISLKHWNEDTPIGYGCRGVTSRESVIATIPVGYADGINRHYGCGRASFWVNGVECPTIGNICMDLCMIDVTGVPGVKVGDRVEIFGRNMPIERLADVLGTIPYEVLTSVSQRVRRTYYRH